MANNVCLVLEDGTILPGQKFGANLDADGEVVFQTGMVSVKFNFKL